MITHHGTFTIYTPAEPPLGEGVVYARDGETDWYDLTKALPAGGYFLVLAGRIIAVSDDPTAFGVYDGMELWSSDEVQPEPGQLWDGNGIVESPLSAADVDAERDRRIVAGFEFASIHYQSAESDRENLAGASIAALAAIGNGAQPGDLRWHGGPTDFVWIATDNSEVPMDAQTMFDLGQAAMAHKQAHIFAGRAIKDAILAGNPPADVTADALWP